MSDTDDVLTSLCERAVVALETPLPPGPGVREAERVLRRQTGGVVRALLALHRVAGTLCECGEAWPCPSLRAVEPVVITSLLRAGNPPVDTPRGRR